MKFRYKIIWMLVWILGGLGLCYILKVDFDWRIGILSIFYGVMGSLLDFSKEN